MNLIRKAYYWFWHDLMCRREPYTHQLRRVTKKCPWLWIGGATAGISLFTWWITRGRKRRRAILIGGAAGGTGFFRLNRQN